MLSVTNGGAKVPTQGATGKLILLTATGKTEVALLPTGVNMMEAAISTKVASGTKAQATINFADKTSINYDLLVK